MKPGCGCVAPSPPSIRSGRRGGNLVYPEPPMSARRRPAARRRAPRRLMAVSLVLAVVAALGGLWFDRASDATEPTHAATAPPPPTQTSSHAAKRALRLTVSRDGRLPAA